MVWTLSDIDLFVEIITSSPKFNISSEYTIKSPRQKFDTVVFFEARNLLNENYETGGLFAENEVSGTGGSGTFVTPGQPLTIFGGMHLRW